MSTFPPLMSWTPWGMKPFKDSNPWQPENAIWDTVRDARQGSKDLNLIQGGCELGYDFAYIMALLIPLIWQSLRVLWFWGITNSLWWEPEDQDSRHKTAASAKNQKPGDRLSHFIGSISCVMFNAPHPNRASLLKPRKTLPFVFPPI